MWTLDRRDQIQDLPLFPGDTSGVPTAINDMIKLWAFQASAIRPLEDTRPSTQVLWENGGVIDLGNLGAQWWNTPTANQFNEAILVGFAGHPAFVEGDILHAFMWTREDGIRHLKPCETVPRTRRQ